MKVEWTLQALDDASIMRNFIAARWSDREVQRFLTLLAAFERHVVRFPRGYPPSIGYPGCRRAWVHENASVVYQLEGDAVLVIAIVDNRSSRPR